MAKRLDNRILQFHSRLMEYVETTFPEIRGNLHLGHYNQYFDLRISEFEFSTKNLEPVTRWLHEWGELELEKPIYLGSSTADGSFRIRYRDPKYVAARYKLTSSLPEIYCLSVKKRAIIDLIEPCLPYTVFDRYTNYFECKELFHLVEIDSAFVTADWARAIIRNAEFVSDARFFRKLSSSLVKPGFRQNIAEARSGLATVLLWYLGGKRLKHFDFLKELQRLEYKIKSDSVTAFPRYLNRLGLRKYRKVRQASN